MKTIRYIVYRYLTPSDYFNIYKAPGSEIGGGGQLYIDFPTSVISAFDWRKFFNGITGLEESKVSNGSKWECPVYSVGLPKSKKARLTMYQRRPQTVCIANQNINVSHA